MFCSVCDRSGWLWTQEPTSEDEGGETLCTSCLAVWVDEMLEPNVSHYAPPERVAHVHCDNCPDDRPLKASIPWVWTAPNGQSECGECIAERLGYRPGEFTDRWNTILFNFYVGVYN